MSVDKAGHEGLAGAVNGFGGFVAVGQVGGRADLNNFIAPDGDEAVLNQGAFVVHSDNSPTGKEVIYFFYGHLGKLLVPGIISKFCLYCSNTNPANMQVVFST